MKINPSLPLNIYKTNAKAGKNINASEKSSGVSKTNADTVSISCEGARYKDIEKMARNMAEELSRDAGQEKIQQLKAAVSNKTYSVSTEKLADTILKNNKD